MKPLLLLTALLLLQSPVAKAQQAHYSGKTIANPYRHDGGLSPVMGVHNIQIMRADREQPAPERNILPWTYNHQPMIAHWKGRLWVHYLSDPQSEHVPPSVTYLQSSRDGYAWSRPEILFPEYTVPQWYSKKLSEKEQQKAAEQGGFFPRENLKAVMHQRVGWYVSSEKTGSRLLAIGNYGICLHPKDDPNDGNGIGRAVREVREDGSLGPIYFLYLNHDFEGKATQYPLYTKAKDKAFRQACKEILANPTYWMQFVEECDRNDARLPMANPYKAFSYYRLKDDTTMVAFWKHALTSQSHDGGRTWTMPVKRAHGFVNSNAKIWGQRLSDGTFATVYNPSEYRWPLALSTSRDGIDYTTLFLIQGEISPMRYGGNYKSYGPQYVRGILPGNGQPADSAMWLAYSMNKEDMWVARVPLPVQTRTLKQANDDFANPQTLNLWNINSLILAPVSANDGWLTLTDSDPYDYARAERIIPETRLLSLDFDVNAEQNDHGSLQMELLSAQGTPCTRLQWQPDGKLTIKVGARYNTLLTRYEAGKTYHISLLCDLDNRNITLWIDGKKAGTKMLFAPVESITRILFRTGDQRFTPTPDTPADRLPGDDLPAKQEQMASYLINNIKTGYPNEINPGHPNEINPAHANEIISDNSGSIAGTTAFPELLQKLHTYVDYFNHMEDENIIQAIPNAEAEAWMQRNIPLFDCPDKQIEEMYYYRWWTYRKAIRQTPVGWGINEFLVDRSYADKYNMIACALGHHIMEGRWLRDTSYVAQNVNLWLRGGENGGPMRRIDTFSSWLPYAMWQMSKTLGSASWMERYNLDLQADLRRWEQTNAYGDGLFWQRDVKDGMEEQISGGRKVNNRRPTINSYMYGNYRALQWLNQGTALADTFRLKADQLKALIEQKLWDKDLRFYTTLTTQPSQKAPFQDSLAHVRELIGYLPWYVNMPDDDPERYTAAWLQLLEPKGFDAPFGMTTAERRHPLFRKKYRPGKPTCEWDGAIWPFATSQTLTALLNVYDHSPALAATLPDTLFFHHLKKYVESQYRRGRPYIGEYLDEKDGQWLMGDRERSRYYNHSTFCDLIITGLCGLRPSMDQSIRVTPHIPASWDYFLMTNIPYHGRLVTIIYDRYGDHYHLGQGLMVLD